MANKNIIHKLQSQKNSPNNHNSRNNYCDDWYSIIIHIK